MDQRGYGLFKWAVSNRQTKLVNSLLEEGVPVNPIQSSNHDFRSPLHSSVYLGCLEITKKLLEKGASVNIFNVNSNTPLMLAAKMRRCEMMDLMLLAKGLENCRNQENFTHLHIACMRNRIDVIRHLVKCKADINSAVQLGSTQWGGYTPLHFAVQYQSIETVEFLLSIGADITLKDAQQLTPLHLADMLRNEKLIDIILAYHKNVVSNPCNSEGLTHFHIACTRNKTEFVKPFLKMGVDLHKSIPKSSMNWPCFTAIDFAIYYECVDIVRLLLLFDDHLQSDNGLNRIKNAYKVGNIELVNLLLTRDQLTNSITKIEQISDIHVACMKNDLVYFKDLLFTNPNISNSAIWKSYTPLHLSIEYKHSELIELMLDYGADFNIQNDEGKSALHLAFDLNMKDIVKLFLNKCTNFHQNPADNDGFSHLHIACIEGDVEVVVRLIECGANVDSPVNFSCIYRPGFTSLHFSALFGNVDVLQKLLNYGACYSAVDKDNKSPFDTAISTSCDSRQSKSAFMIMEIILSFHHLHKDRFFNDRGFSRLHMWSINGSARDDKSEVRYFIDEHPSDVNKTVHILNTPWDGYTPLHFALELGNTSLANVLLEKGANILCKAANGDTPLHLALNCSIMPQLPSNLHHFASIQQNPIGSKGFSFFHVACVAGHKELIEYFLDNGINPDFPSKIEGYEFNDKTPLHFTVQNNSSCAVEVSSLLLRFGANPNARDSELNTPLHYIKGQCHSKVINVLIDHGADVNALNAIFETPLLTLCKNAHNANSEMLQEKLELLLDKGANINITDEKGATPLALTSWNIESHSLLVEILLKHVIKFETVGFYVSKTNQKAYSSLLSRFSNELHFNEISFDELCLAELERMKLTHTNDFMAPYDILFKNLNQLAMMVENQVFQQMIDSYDFRKKYPIYGPMLELQLSKGKSRKPLFSESKKAFNYLISYALPEACTENILQNLDANNLKNIVAARQPLYGSDVVSTLHISQVQVSSNL